MKPPAPRPCVSCPYRRDVPSGVWAYEEYRKLPTFDGETGEQDPGVFLCHQQDGKVCAGWAAVHEMEHSLGLRLAVSLGAISPEDADAIIDYTTDVPLFESGREAALHGLRSLLDPDPRARRMIERLSRRRP